jgi:hypothetical protein
MSSFCNTGLNKIRHFVVYIRNCYAFSREVDVGSDNGDPSRVGGTESILLNGTNLTTMIGPSPSGGNVVSLDSGAAVNKNQQKVMSLC